MTVFTRVFKLVLLAAVVRAGASPAAALSLPASATINDDRFFANAQKLAVGDFNGDGVGDIAWESHYGQDHKVNIIFGKARKGVYTLGKETGFRVTFNGHGGVDAMAFGDVNGDGKDDLVLGSAAQSYPAGVFVVFGRETGGSINVDRADLRVTGAAKSDGVGQAVAIGDFDNDGKFDMALAAAGKAGGLVYLVKGRNFPRGAQLALPAAADSVIQVPASRDTIDANGFFALRQDGPDSLVISASSLRRGEAPAGAAYILKGGSWPAVWDLARTPASLTILGDPEYPELRALAGGDFTGDGRAELALNNSVGPQLLDDALSSGPTLDLKPGAAWSRTTAPFSGGLNNDPCVMGDFDGDGRADLFATFLGKSVIGYLSAGYPAGAAPDLSDADVSIPGNIRDIALADVNGDQLQDLLVLAGPTEDQAKTSLSTSTAPVYATLTIYHGFRPVTRQGAQGVKDLDEAVEQAGRLAERGDWARALLKWRQAVAQSPTDAAALAGLARAQSALYEAADAAHGAGDLPRAHLYFRQLAMDSAEYRDAAARAAQLARLLSERRAASAQEHFASGVTAYAAGDYQRALFLLRQAGEILPKDPAVQRALERAEEKWRRHGPPKERPL